MTWLITGGTGQLGLALQTELTRRRIDFVAPKSTELDITNPLLVNQVIDFVKPAIIVNTAAWTDVDGAESNAQGAYLVNALGPKNLASAVSKTKTKFIQISTDYVFSGNSPVPWSENGEHNPQSVYGQTKSDGEKFTFEHHPKSSYIVRTAWLYSANRKNFALTMTKLALFGDTKVRVVNDQVGQPTFAGDLAQQVIDLIESEAQVGNYHGTNSGQATWFEFAQEIFRLCDADDSRVIPVSTSEFPRPAIRPTYSVLGHESWAHTVVPPLRDWRIALAEAMPAIILSLKGEG